MSEYGWADTDWGATDPAGAWQHKYEVEREKNDALRSRLAEAERFIEELRDESAEDWRTSKYVVVQMTEETWDKLKAWGTADSADVCTWPTCRCKRGSDYECAQGYPRPSDREDDSHE